MIEVVRFSQLSAQRQRLVRLCQSINYGVIQRLTVSAGEPTFNPAPSVLVEVKLDGAEGGRAELKLADFIVCDEVRRLMQEIEALGNGSIDRIEVRAGLPRRIILESSFAEVLR